MIEALMGGEVIEALMLAGNNFSKLKLCFDSERTGELFNRDFMPIVEVGGRKVMDIDVEFRDSLNVFMNCAWEKGYIVDKIGISRTTGVK